MPDDESSSLQACFADAEAQRTRFEHSLESSADAAQATLTTAIDNYTQSLRIADDIALFSPNEVLDDISSGDLQYLLINYWIADLTLRLVAGDRKEVLQRAAKRFEAFLNLLDSYRILSADDVKTYERYRESPTSFSVAFTTDAVQRRQTKIAKFKEEKALKDKLEHLRRRPATIARDDGLARNLNLTHIALRTQQTFAHLDSIAQELDILSQAPDPAAALPPNNTDTDTDARARSRAQDTYSDRVDRPLSELLRNGRGGPILAPDGKPLRPFTLLDKRSQMRAGVFRPDHSLPTMSIDEYLAEEMARGGMVSGGGAASMAPAAVDEDDEDAADAATMKARAWDEFVEANPKGAGNRMNNG